LLNARERNKSMEGSFNADRNYAYGGGRKAYVEAKRGGASALAASTGRSLGASKSMGRA